MSYTKTNWQTGDVITAEKLNKLENGVEAVLMVLHILADDEYGANMHWDATAKEIYDAFRAGTRIIIEDVNGYIANQSNAVYYDSIESIEYTPAIPEEGRNTNYNFNFKANGWVAYADNEYPHPYWD